MRRPRRLIPITCVTALAALCAAAGAWPARQERSPDELYDAARRDLSCGETARAIELLADCVAADPRRAEFQLALADAHRAAGQLQTARRILEQAWRAFPDDARVAGALASLLGEEGAWGRVVELLGPIEGRLGAGELVLLARARRAGGAEEEAEATLARGVARFGDDLGLRLAQIDALLERERYAGALEAVGAARRTCGPSGELHLRAARAHLGLGQLLGSARVAQVPGGRAGQFANEGLLVERREGPERFLVCPPESALYQVRRALDAGLETAEAHLLHAEVWRRIGRPRVAMQIVRGREALLLSNADVRTLEALCRIAMEADELRDFARYARLQARRDPAHSRQVLKQAYLALAARFNEGGDARMYVECLRRAERLAPQDGELVLRLADAAWAAAQHETAVACYRRVLELNPEHPQRARIAQRLAEFPVESPAWPR